MRGFAASKAANQKLMMNGSLLYGVGSLGRFWIIIVYLECIKCDSASGRLKSLQISH